MGAELNQQFTESAKLEKTIKANPDIFWLKEEAFEASANLPPEPGVNGRLKANPFDGLDAVPLAMARKRPLSASERRSATSRRSASRPRSCHK